MPKVISVKGLKMLLATGVATSMLSGCATVINGTTKGVSFDTTPEKAQVYETKDDSKKLKEICKKTPCKAQLSRGSDHHIVIKKDGYSPYDILIKSVSNNVGESIGGNILAGGPIGMAVDGVDGADDTLKPDKVNVTLSKLASATSPTVSTNS